MYLNCFANSFNSIWSLWKVQQYLSGIWRIKKEPFLPDPNLFFRNFIRIGEKKLLSIVKCQGCLPLLLLPPFDWREKKSNLGNIDFLASTDAVNKVKLFKEIAFPETQKSEISLLLLQNVYFTFPIVISCICYLESTFLQQRHSLSKLLRWKEGER